MIKKRDGRKSVELSSRDRRTKAWRKSTSVNREGEGAIRSVVTSSATLKSALGGVKLRAAAVQQLLYRQKQETLCSVNANACSSLNVTKGVIEKRQENRHRRHCSRPKHSHM
jgi:hypothetical protein